MSKGTYEIVEAGDVDSWSAEVDVVVVGLGCAGVCAAIESVVTPPNINR